jgi:predicted nucleic acid-binding protein
MIVVDTNIIAYLYLSSPHSIQVQEALLKDSHWAAPYLWRSELRNVLALYMRQGRLSLNDAQLIMDEALMLMRGREYTVASAPVLNLVASSTCSAYDCEFVVLAQDLGVPLVTVDKQILGQFPDVAISPKTFITVASE